MKLALTFLISILFSTITLADVNVTISTSAGDIKLALNDKEAPVTVENFVKYAESGSYNGTIFHRVIPNFMIQGGGFNARMEQIKTLPPIENEASKKLPNLRGTIAMARTNDPHSATSQFFINHKDNANLNPGMGGWGYAVFGRVTEGMDIVDKIAAVKTGTVSYFRDVPVQPILINSITVNK